MASEEEEQDYSEKFKQAEEKKAQELFAKRKAKQDRGERIKKWQEERHEKGH